MTIPRIPGLFDSLGQGLNLGYSAYQGEKEKQYEQAKAGANLILQQIQQGTLRPEQLSDPTTMQMFQQAKIPQIPPQNIVPSVRAATADRTVGRIGATQPGSREEGKLLGFPQVADLKEQEILDMAGEVKARFAAENPAFLRKLGGFLGGPEGAVIEEQAQLGDIGSKTFDDVAFRFVSEAGGNANKAYALASTDPQWKSLIDSGQFSQEFFAKAAREWYLGDMDWRTKRLAAINSGLNQERYQFDAQRKSYDVEIGQLQTKIKENALEPIETMTLNVALGQLQNGMLEEQLDPIARGVLQKARANQATQNRIDELQQQRGELRGQYIGATNPTPNPSGEVDPAKVATAKGMIRRGKATEQQTFDTPTLSEAEKEQILGTQKYNAYRAASRRP